jgi:hypothetical protein
MAEVQQAGQFIPAEAGQRQVEAEAVEFPQLQRQQVDRPRRICEPNGRRSATSTTNTLSWVARRNRPCRRCSRNKRNQ